MTNDLHYFMFFVGRLCQGAEMMIKHSEFIEADESNLMYDFVAAREATREALRDVKEYLAQVPGPAGAGGPKPLADR
jgi:4'-phosphopantetheinyl transferase EntD